MSQYRELGEYIVIDPDLANGEPVFRGGGLPVRFILDEVASGKTPAEIVADWRGDVSEAAIREAIFLKQLGKLDVTLE